MGINFHENAATTSIVLLQTAQNGKLISFVVARPPGLRFAVLHFEETVSKQSDKLFVDGFSLGWSVESHFCVNCVMVIGAVSKRIKSATICPIENLLIQVVS